MGNCVKDTCVVRSIFLDIRRLRISKRVNYMKALDKGPFILYLCIDILIDQSVNPQVEWGRQLMSKGAMAGS